MDLDKLKGLLGEHHLWPEEYTFKFIVKPEHLEELKGLLNSDKIVIKPSSKGTYISVTLELTMNSSDEVINIYEKVSRIEGIISL